MKTKNIRQEIFIDAPPSQVYAALMDSKVHTEFTGDIAQIGKNVGDEFSAYGGYATGKNIKLERNKLIVQSWRASNWPIDHYSTIQFVFKSKNGGTLLIFNQSGIPEDFVEDISDGWMEYYWKPLNAMFDKNKKNKQ